MHAEICQRKDLKANANRSRVMVLEREEGFACEKSVDGKQLKTILGFKYLGLVLYDSGTDGVECCMKVANGMKNLL